MKSTPLLIGSNNPDKARELARLLEGLPWDVKSLGDYAPVEEPEETGATCEENAALKAAYYGKAFAVACAADDTGLEVDALNGAPGVYSARYAGEACSYADNNAKMLAELAEVPEADRTARFVCCAAFYAPGRDVYVVRGVVEGTITTASRGSNGFGYDPLFVPAGGSRTFAEMTPEEKQSISHRGRAFTKLRAHLDGLT
jgi:XTP/dITP diphosphohydrolase